MSRTAFKSAQPPPPHFSAVLTHFQHCSPGCLSCCTSTFCFSLPVLIVFLSPLSHFFIFTLTLPCCTFTSITLLPAPFHSVSPDPLSLFLPPPQLSRFFMLLPSSLCSRSRLCHPPLSIELQAQEQPPEVRSDIYSHMEAFVPCNKEALLKRLKKLSLNIQVREAHPW